MSPLSKLFLLCPQTGVQLSSAILGILLPPCLSPLEFHSPWAKFTIRRNYIMCRRDFHFDKHHTALRISCTPICMSTLRTHSTRTKTTLQSNHIMCHHHHHHHHHLHSGKKKSTPHSISISCTSISTPGREFHSPRPKNLQRNRIKCHHHFHLRKSHTSLRNPCTPISPTSRATSHPQTIQSPGRSSQQKPSLQKKQTRRREARFREIRYRFRKNESEPIGGEVFRRQVEMCGKEIGCESREQRGGESAGVR